MKIFYLIIIISGLYTILASNPVHSLLGLILTFFFSSIIALILKSEFLSMLFLIIYIGAVIILFLFIIMMLNVKIVTLNFQIIKYIPISFGIIILFFIEISYITNLALSNINLMTFLNENTTFLNINLIKFFQLINNNSNIQSIAQLLFIKFAYLFIIAGMILLVAMIGGIYLTLNQNFISKRQNLFYQINKNISQSIKLINTKHKNIIE